MRVAVLNSWPNLSISAEREFIVRLMLAGEQLGWSIIEATTSDELLAIEPDVVLVTHEFSPKLTRFPTIGLIWSPVAFFSPDANRIRNILSYDGYLVASQPLRNYVVDLLQRHGKVAPVSQFDFLPSALGTSAFLPDTENKAPSELFYAGVHWDGSRHGDLFTALNGQVPLAIYGNPEKWKSAGSNYRGSLPFDGLSVVQAIRDCGIALALHGKEHRAENIPSMRLFEAAAAGAVIISDGIGFARREFGDSLLYVDATADAAVVSQQIADHVKWIFAHPVEARALAQRAQIIFKDRFALESLLARLKDFTLDVKNCMGAHNVYGETVDVIVRIGSRPLKLVERAIASVAAQTYQNIRLVIVAFRPVPGLEELLAKYTDRFEALDLVQAPDDGIRSTPLWMGLNAAKGSYVCNLDDDDAIYPNHLSLMVSTIQNAPESVPVVYSGVIQVQEDDGYWFDQDNFLGDLKHVVEERRKLRFLEVFDKKRLWHDNYIQSNAWLARRSAFDSDLLVDPKLVVAEDVCLYCSLALKGPFISTWSPTAEWNWRSSSKDNIMFSPELWAKVEAPLRQRLTAAGMKLEEDALAETQVGLIEAQVNNSNRIAATQQATVKFFRQPKQAIPRLKFAFALLRYSGPRAMIQHVLRFGRRQ